MVQPTHRNPLVKALAVLGAILLTAMAILVGAVAFLAFVGLGIIAFIAFQLRLWWIRRRIAAARRRQPHHDASSKGAQGSARRPGRVIEGDYHRDESERNR